jgi:hypothetical protein
LAAQGDPIMLAILPGLNLNNCDIFLHGMDRERGAQASR